MDNNANTALPCEVIKDLMPYYVEELTSKKTNQIVAEHLENCAECKSVYAAMCNPELEEEITQKNEENAKKVRYLKKVKRRNRAVASLIAVWVMLAGIVIYYFAAVKIYSYPVDKMQISERYELEDGSIYVKVKFDSQLPGNGTAYSNSGNLGAANFSFLLGYRFTDKLKISEEEKNAEGYLHFLFKPDEENQRVYISGWNMEEKLLIWELGEQLAAPDEAKMQEIEKVLPRLGAGYAATY